ncbi:MAG: hypothetical protein AB7F43_02000 [Bacteriovoracia bacterium]
MKRQNLYPLSLLALNLCIACSTPGRSIGAGAGVGAASGAAMGYLADPGQDGENRVRNVVIGSAIGGVLGAGVGFAADQLVKDEKQESYEKGKADAKKETPAQYSQAPYGNPTLLPAKTEAKWVPDQVRGNTFVPGHYEYIIIEGARWDASR